MDNNDNLRSTTSQEPKLGNTMVMGAIAMVLLVVGGLWLFNSKKATPVNSDVQETNNTETGVKGETTENTTTETQTYTLTDVAEHASDTDCWMVIEGKVYDVTSFVMKHPGGKAIVNGCGKDATVLFNERPTNDKGPHPASAKEMLVPLYIGELKAD